MADLISPELLEGGRLYAVGDVRGRTDLLTNLFDRINSDRAASLPHDRNRSLVSTRRASQRG
jgi:hypothetical protein